MNYKIYVFSSQLISYSNYKINVDGWYKNKDKAIKDLIRSSIIDSRQFILVYKEKIVAVANSGKIYEFT